MNRREDVLNLLKGKNPEYVPWFGDLAYWISYLKDEKKIPEKYLSKKNEGVYELSEEGLQQLHKDLDVGFYLQGCFPFKTIYNGVDYKENIEENKKIVTIETPYGKLREVWEYVKMTYSWAPREMFLKSSDDIKAFKYVYNNISYEPDYELLDKRLELIGNNGVVLAYTPKTPLMELIALKAGITTVVELLMDEEEELRELLSVMEKRNEEAMMLAVKSPAECIMVPENMSSEIVGGTLYDDWIEPIHKRWTQKIREEGKYSFVHLDGTLVPLLTKLSNAGFDVIEAVTPEPVGDVALEDLRSMVKEETIIWGGIPGGFFANEMTDEEFQKYIIKVLKLMKNNNKFVLGVADEVVPKTDFARIKMVSKLVKKYGKYE